MTLLTYPAIAYGAADDVSVSPWTASNVTRTAGVTDPFGGSGACVLADSSAGAIGYIAKPIVFADDGAQLIQVCVRQNSSNQTAQALVQLVDTTATLERGGMLLTFSGTALTVSNYLIAASAIFPTVSLGDNWSLLHALVPGIVKGNTNQLRIYPASTNAAAQTSMRVFLRPIVLLDLLNPYRRFRRPRSAYKRGSAPSGTSDAWTWGNETVRRGQVGWIPSAARTWPVHVSGFDGANESVGVNPSVSAMLESGWESPLRWIPDRTNFGRYQDCDMVSPGEDWSPELHNNGDQQFELELVTPTVPGGLA